MSNRNPEPPRGYLYRNAAAARLGVGTTTLWRLVTFQVISQYVMPGAGPTSRKLYKISELDELAAKRRKVHPA